ncbi:MAG: hypothetical protein ABI488_10325 [Polyangiaceae bacterium]
MGLNAEHEAAVGEGESGGEALSAAWGAGEEEIATGDGKHANSSLDTAVVDFKAAVVEAAAKELTLIDGGGTAR